MCFCLKQKELMNNASLYVLRCCTEMHGTVATSQNLIARRCSRLQKQGVDEKLWAAALGCLCQLCMQQGALIQQHTKALSPRAAVGLLHACTRYHW